MDSRSLRSTRRTLLQISARQSYAGWVPFLVHPGLFFSSAGICEDEIRGLADRLIYGWYLVTVKCTDSLVVDGQCEAFVGVTCWWQISHWNRGKGSIFEVMGSIKSEVFDWAWRPEHFLKGLEDQGLFFSIYTIWLWLLHSHGSHHHAINR